MKKIFGFSLAEALITLLIVSIIAVASAPIITKKARKKADSVLWNYVKKEQEYIYPAQNRDIMLGSKKTPKGITVNGVLVFKNTKGQTIGWIAEDGSSSFTQTSLQMENAAAGLGSLPPEEINKIVKAVSESMQRQNTHMQIPTPASAQQPGNQEDMTKQINEMSKDIDLGALLKGMN